MTGIIWWNLSVLARTQTEPRPETTIVETKARTSAGPEAGTKAEIEAITVAKTEVRTEVGTEVRNKAGIKGGSKTFHEHWNRELRPAPRQEPRPEPRPKIHYSAPVYEVQVVSTVQFLLIHFPDKIKYIVMCITLIIYQITETAFIIPFLIFVYFTSFFCPTFFWFPENMAISLFHNTTFPKMNWLGVYSGYKRVF